MIPSILPFLQTQITQHPGTEPRDVLKLCYQAAYGGEHLLSDLSKAEAYFNQEFARVQPREEPLYELISPQIARVHLRAWKQAGLPGKWLFRLFLLSAQIPTCGNLTAYLDEGEKLNFPGFHAARLAYEAAGCPGLHHSDRYRRMEQPAYRVVHCRLLRLLPILTRAVLVPGDTNHVLAIDGRAASGKTTMGEQLASILDGTVIHMDHFFLPPQLRTRARLDEPGGNVHYERFCEEVLPGINRGETFSYRRFDCSQRAYGEWVTVSESPWRIVEGSYSLHPKFGSYYDLSVFSSVSPEEQVRRIEARDGAEMLKMFQEKWIPMEERYFTAFDVAESAMLCC